MDLFGDLPDPSGDQLKGDFLLLLVVVYFNFERSWPLRRRNTQCFSKTQ